MLIHFTFEAEEEDLIDVEGSVASNLLSLVLIIGKYYFTTVFVVCSMFLVLLTESCGAFEAAGVFR